MGGSPSERLSEKFAPLIAVFRRYPEILAVYLFGSYADGTARADSDIDLGILPRTPDFHSRLLDLLADLTKAGFDRVDIVFLDQADLTTRYEVVRRNTLLYAAPDFYHGDYFSRTLREYWDFEPYLRVAREAYKERLLHDGTP